MKTRTAKVRVAVMSLVPAFVLSEPSAGQASMALSELLQRAEGSNPIVAAMTEAYIDGYKDRWTVEQLERASNLPEEDRLRIVDALMECQSDGSFELFFKVARDQTNGLLDPDVYFKVANDQRVLYDGPDKLDCGATNRMRSQRQPR